MTVIITCEHAGNIVPDPYKKYFINQEEILNSHRGWDPGALPIAKVLANTFQATLFYYPHTRLLIEVNRSLHHPDLFSEFTNSLSNDQKQILIDDYYLPYRKPIESFILKSSKPIIHLSIHSFTPIWNGQARTTDIGLLFDPERKPELSFCQKLQSDLAINFPGFTIDWNKPYAGIDDGFTTYLRSRWSEEEYLGIEIEVNQKYAAQTDFISHGLAKALQRCFLLIKSI